jgi:nucleoside-diphosphate-sugar epimerase
MTTSLIIGCGYLGATLAAQLRREGSEVWVTARSASRLAELMTRFKTHGVQFDLNASAEPLPILELGANAILDVYCLLTPSALATPEARKRLLEFMARLPIRRAILTSSTGIYDVRNGAVVTAETALVPASERSQRLLAIEDAWLQAPLRFVVRLAGLYGASRIIGAQALRAGATIPGAPSALLNLIHRSDAASLLRACMAASRMARIELGSDGTPITREHYYQHTAALLGAPAPVFEDANSTRDLGKAVDSSGTMARVEWQPDFPSFREGLTEALAASSAE